MRQKILYVIFFVLIGVASFASNEKKNTILIPIVKIENEPLKLILDSLIAKEKKCPENGHVFYFYISTAKYGIGFVYLYIGVVDNFRKMLERKPMACFQYDGIFCFITNIEPYGTPISKELFSQTNMIHEFILPIAPKNAITVINDNSPSYWRYITYDYKKISFDVGHTRCK